MSDKNRVKIAFQKFFGMSEDAAAMAAVPGVPLAEAQAKTQEYPGGLGAMHRRIDASVAAHKGRKKL